MSSQQAESKAQPQLVEIFSEGVILFLFTCTLESGINVGVRLLILKEKWKENNCPKRPKLMLELNSNPVVSIFRKGGLGLLFVYSRGYIYSDSRPRVVQRKLLYFVNTVFP